MPDSNARARPWTAVMGLAYVVLVIGMFALLGQVPDKNDAGLKLAHYFSDHQGALLAASVLLVLASTAAVGFWAGVRRLLAADSGGSSLEADVGLVSAVLLFAMAGAAAGALQTGAFMAGTKGGLDPALARVMSGLVTALVNLSAAPTLLLVLGFGLALLRSELWGRWAPWTLFVVGAAHIGALVSVAHGGVLGPAGFFAYLAPILYTAWSLAASVVLLRQTALRPVGMAPADDRGRTSVRA